MPAPGTEDIDLQPAPKLATFERDTLDDLVLGTTNAPYRRAISADQLTVCLSSCESGSWKVHVATFFTEVRPELVLRFAELHGVSMSELASAYHAMKVVTGEANPVLEADLEQLAPTAR